MGNTGSKFTTSPLPVSARQKLGYPAHDPLLAHYAALISRNQLDIPNIAVEEDRNPHNPTTEFESSNTQNQLELTFMTPGIPGYDRSILSRDEQHTTVFIVGISESLHESTTTENEQVHADSLPPTEYIQVESPNSQIQLELASIITDNPDSDLRDGQHTIRSDSYSNPRQAAYLFGACVPFFTPILVKLMREGRSHSPVVNLVMIISTIAYVTACLDLCVLFWIYERLGNSNSSHRNMFLGCYRILKDVYYILCFIVIFSLLPVLLIPFLHHPQPQPHPCHRHRHHH